MKSISIMQPYFLPYAGYFQLIASGQTFVSLDDVSYIKRGWINRNTIKQTDGRELRITIPLVKASQNKKINQTYIQAAGWQEKLLKSIRQCYQTAPQFKSCLPLIESIVYTDESNLARFVENSIRRIGTYLGLHPEFLRASQVPNPTDCTGAQRILQICEELGAQRYVNASGGTDLYNVNAFQNAGIKLKFMSPALLCYSRAGSSVESKLSILDMMMYVPRNQCEKLIHEVQFQ